MPNTEPANMRALCFHSYGEWADVLRLENAPVPKPGVNQIRVRVHACALNPMDWVLCLGFMPGALPRGLGLDVSGTVDAVGEGLLVFCDEDAPQASPLEALSDARTAGGVGLIIGPEGGFDEWERAEILKLPHVLRLSLGLRVLRADTAAVAALALIQATLGDWPRPSPGD
jgi:NADPH:quinone reductase-like Zn-dependent oxidoreductase